ncbi:uncharacterized protein V1518DRAFT_430026 [Limtongia smithiae]|uniref:uncharacterized protein n=1 Tax=Limtongia smithiae TaxID=1125753 RepID=UPI0034CD780F
MKEATAAAAWVRKGSICVPYRSSCCSRRRSVCSQFRSLRFFTRHATFAYNYSTVATDNTKPCVADIIAGTVTLPENSRTIYIGNVPFGSELGDILDFVNTSHVVSVSISADDSRAYMSFISTADASQFRAEVIVRLLAVNSQKIEVGWASPSPLSGKFSDKMLKSKVSRVLYLGNIPSFITESEIRRELSCYGSLDTILYLHDKRAAIVYFYSISSAILASRWLRKNARWTTCHVYSSEDRRSYVPWILRDDAAHFLKYVNDFEHLITSADRDKISSDRAEEYTTDAAAAANSTTTDGQENIGNRSVLVSNIPDGVSLSRLCNAVRLDGPLQYIKYFPRKRSCIFTFIDPLAAAHFVARSEQDGLTVLSQPVAVSWGEKSRPLPAAVALAVTAGASRMIYIGNIDESWSKSSLRQDFSKYGGIESVRISPEKQFAFVSFLSIGSAVRAVRWIKLKDKYRNCIVNFGRDIFSKPHANVPLES